MAVRVMITNPDQYTSTDGNPQVRELTADEAKFLIPEGATYAETSRMVTTWEGCVLRLGEHNWHDDSDFFAVVWDAAAGQPREVEYGTTRFPTYGNVAHVDATEDVMAAYKAWETAGRLKRLAAAEEAERATPRPGKTVVVTGGRKLAKGTTGEVFWYGEDKYNRSQWVRKYRVGIKTDAGQKVFLDAAHVEVDQTVTAQTWLNKIAAVVWVNTNLPGNIHADELTMKLMEISHEWTERAPERCGKLDYAVELIDGGKELEHALALVKEALA